MHAEVVADKHALVREANHLVELAQLGQAHEVLQTVERRLTELAGGNMQTGPAALHFARAVALMYDDDVAALAAVEDMLRAAVRENSQGWAACALAMRATQKQVLGDQDPALYDVNAVLADLTAAEAALDRSADGGRIDSRAHVAISNGYAPLRLYELAVPHQEAAFRISLDGAGPDDAAPSMWLLNLTILNLEWALDLYRVGLDREAEQHSALAYDHATYALDRLNADAVAGWKPSCQLFQAAARSDGVRPTGAVAEIQRLLPVVRELGDAHEYLLAVPFLAVGLMREGRREESLAVIEQALAEVRPSDRTSTTYLSLAHTHAVLIVNGGSEEAKAAMEYGNALAAASWRERQRTLDSAETMRKYAQLQAEHDQVTRAAESDALTGVANRRCFDRHVEALASTGDPGRPVAVLFVDLDEFKVVNDSLGHAAGDTMLQGVARVIAANAREGDLVARIGGDEFAVLLPGASTEDTERAAQRIVVAVRDTQSLPLVSIGGAAGSARDVRATVVRADDAMYVAKRGGRDQHHVAPSLA